MDMSIFREYDIRGIFEENLTRQSVFGIGRLLGERIKAAGEQAVAIGYDARTHSPVLYEWLRDGFIASGVEVYFMGMIPTPVAYFATFQHAGTWGQKGAGQGENLDSSVDSLSRAIKSSVMITGSHNPPQYNGFKITISQKPFYGEQIRALGAELAGLLEQGELSYTGAKESANLQAKPLDALQAYQDFLVKHFEKLRGFPYEVVFDYGNGVGAIGLESVLDRLGIKHVSLYETPDGTFPNHHPDPSEEKNLADIRSAMKARKIPIGIAFDGDADRVALMSENHNYKGDEMAILFARDMAKHIARPIVIGEVKCSQVMYDEINAIGQAVMYKTGHSNLKTKLKELNAHLAAEMSGHLFFHDRYFGYDDALYAALRALELFVESTPAQIESAINALPKLYSTDEEKIPTTEERKFAQIEALKSALQSILKSAGDTPPSGFPHIREIIDIDGVRVVFDDGWALVRASNTTPVLVTRFEATSQEALARYKQEILSLLQGC